MKSFRPKEPPSNDDERLGDRRKTWHPGYARSRGLRQTKRRGCAKVDWAFFAATAYDLGAVADADLRGNMTDPAARCELTGRWRIIKADIWDRDYLDMVGAGLFADRQRRLDRVAFGCVIAGGEGIFAHHPLLPSERLRRSL
jgi:hypothetical protein